MNDADTNLKTGLLETKVEILHSSDVIRSGIYTAQYVPRHIDEPDEVVTIGGITFLSTGVTEHPIKRGIETVES